MTNTAFIQPLIFTDLDGSLLDHNSYSFAPAEPLLKRLETLDVPVIPITSKTFAEVVSLRIDLNNNHPFIIENGAAIAIPKDYFSTTPGDAIEKDDFWLISNSEPRQHWLELLMQKAQGFEGEFETFTSVVKEKGYRGLQDITGLSLKQAELSNKRNYSEPIHWLGNDQRKQEFIKQLTAAGGTLLQGGRFIALGGNIDKGKALLQLAALYQQDKSLSQIHTLAIGDSGNDISMLDAATTAIIIHSKKHPAPKVTRSSNLILSSACGPEGWNESVALWLTNFSEIGSKNYG